VEEKNSSDEESDHAGDGEADAKVQVSEEAFLSEKTNKDGGLGLSLVEGDVIVEIDGWDVSSGHKNQTKWSEVGGVSREEGNRLTSVSMTASLEGGDEGSAGENASGDGQKSVHS